MEYFFNPIKNIWFVGTFHGKVRSYSLGEERNSDLFLSFQASFLLT